MRIGPSFAALLAIMLAPPGATYAQVCGNGVRESPEQCDDGNTVNLDGCSATCTFEQVQRVNQLALQGTPAPAALACIPATNRLGSQSITSTGLAQVNSGISTSVANGSTSALIYFAGLADLSGTSATGFGMGLLNGEPASTSGYNGASDVDWWYVPDPLEIDGARLPLDFLPNGSLAAHNLTGGPGAFDLRTDFGGTLTTLHLSSLKIGALTGTSSTPGSYDGSTTKGHLPTENLDPALTSFETADATGVGEGLCGNISAESLALTPLSSTFITGSSACSGSCPGSSAYTIANSALDMLVGGCKVLYPICVTVVSAQQPDTADPGAPPAGAGGPYLLTASTASKIIDTCKDNNNATVPLTTCLAAAAYSSYFQFSTDRVMFTNDRIFQNGFE